MKLIRQAQVLANRKSKREEELQEKEASFALLKAAFSKFAGLEAEDAV